MRNRKKLVIGAAALILAGGATGGALAATSSGDDDTPVVGPDADRARAAAVQATGAGSVAGTVERDDEDGATWEVEVKKADGGSVDVRLDSGFQVVVVEPDSESPDDGD